MDRYDALCARESNGRSYFTKLGAAFPNKDGKGFIVLLDAMPAAVDGQYKIMLREPLPRDGDKQSQDGNRLSQMRGSGRSGYDDSDTPF